MSNTFLLRSLVKNHDVLVWAELAYHLVEDVSIDLAAEHLDELKLHLRLHIRNIVEEMVDERLNEL